MVNNAVSKWAKEWVDKALIVPASGVKRITSYILSEKYRNKFNNNF